IPAAPVEVDRRAKLRALRAALRCPEGVCSESAGGVASRVQHVCAPEHWMGLHQYAAQKWRRGAAKFFAADHIPSRCHFLESKNAGRGCPAFLLPLVGAN